MADDDLFFETLDAIDGTHQKGRGEDLLKAVVERFGLCHAAYLAVDLPDLEGSVPHAEVTYPPDWVAHYISQNYLDVDPVLRAGRRSLLPVDWAELDTSAPRVARLFAEARDARLGRQGLTFPVRGRLGERALFSVTAEMPERAWSAFKRRHSRDFQMIAVHFHEMVLRSEGVDRAVPHLTPREIECLRWAARGKSFEDIADILSVSSRSVKFYLDISRHKLNCLNVTHAVARAMAMQIIGPPD